jgi:hypothetical protein
MDLLPLSHPKAVEFLLDAPAPPKGVTHFCEVPLKDGRRDGRLVSHQARGLLLTWAVTWGKKKRAWKVTVTHTGTGLGVWPELWSATKAALLVKAIDWLAEQLDWSRDPLDTAAAIKARAGAEQRFFYASAPLDVLAQAYERLPRPVPKLLTQLEEAGTLPATDRPTTASDAATLTDLLQETHPGVNVSIKAEDLHLEVRVCSAGERRLNVHLNSAHLREILKTTKGPPRLPAITLRLFKDLPPAAVLWLLVLVLAAPKKKHTPAACRPISRGEDLPGWEATVMVIGKHVFSTEVGENADELAAKIKTTPDDCSEEEHIEALLKATKAKERLDRIAEDRGDEHYHERRYMVAPIEREPYVTRHEEGVRLVIAKVHVEWYREWFGVDIFTTGTTFWIGSVGHMTTFVDEHTDSYRLHALRLSELTSRKIPANAYKGRTFSPTVLIEEQGRNGAARVEGTEEHVSMWIERIERATAGGDVRGRGRVLIRREGDKLILSPRRRRDRPDPPPRLIVDGAS